MEDPEVYLKRHFVLTYIEDAVSFILERKSEDAKTKPFELFAEYFKSIKLGTHILFREYAFVSKTPHNRISFIKVFSQTYTEIAARNKTMRVSDYLSLVRLLCHDFPELVIQRINQVLFMQNSMDNLVSFQDFLYTFQTIFYYEHFLHLCGLIVQNGETPLAPHTSSTVVVSMPSALEQSSTNQLALSGEDKPSQFTSDAFQSESVGKRLDVNVFMAAVINLVQRLQDKEPWECCPSIETLCAIMHGLESLSFVEFVVLLSKSETVNSEIGVLPQKLN